MPFFSRVFFAIACFFRVIFDGKFASAVEKTKALPPSGAKSSSSKPTTSNGERDERHAIPPAEVEGETRDTDSLPPPDGSRVRDTINDAVRSTPTDGDDDDDDLDSIPPVSTESHNTGLRRRSPPKPNTVPPPPDDDGTKPATAEVEANRAPPTEPSRGTTPPPSLSSGELAEKRVSFVEVVSPRSESATVEKPEAAASVDNPKPAPDSAPESFDVALSEITKVTAAISTPVAKPAAEATPEGGYPARERGALLLLALLQREGRFVDFLQQDVTDFDDGQVGAAARVVHEGCRRALKGHLKVSAIRAEAEGDKVTLDVGYDVQANKLVGNVTGKPPYKGSVQHRGWRAERLELPKEVGDHDPSVLAQAEVEL